MSAVKSAVEVKSSECFMRLPLTNLRGLPVSLSGERVKKIKRIYEFESSSALAKIF